ncbi:MAG: cell envelope integrity protein CreD [Fibrobacterota bacterium]|nr:cell envelope integrity protein CreD [Chitinispirillaceae bacterium]
MATFNDGKGTVTAMTAAKSSLTIKLGTIGLLILILMIPSVMLEKTLKERKSLYEAAKSDVSRMWGGSQVIAGPVLVIPYMSGNEYDSRGTLVSINTKKYAYFLPDNLKINGEVLPEIRKRGIYNMVLYKSQIELSGDFEAPDIEALGIPIDKVLLNQAYLSIGITDMQGISEMITVSWDNNLHKVEPGIGIGLNNMISSGVHIPLGKNSDAINSNKHTFKTQIQLKGSECLQFLPLGKETDVGIVSNWNNPSFNGKYLPSEREVRDSGFNAQWKILQLNRNYPQKWTGGTYELNQSAFGVDLIMPVDEYLKISRTNKYSLLFVALTFCAFFFIEVMSRRRLHAIQYLLIGFAICLFYYLLLSLAECIGFGYAYLIAGFAITALITGYSQAVFVNVRLSGIIAAVLGGLYSFLYVTLQQQDYALLMGSIGLFVILAVTMFLTSKIDWYAIGKNCVPENANRSDDKNLL